MIQTQFFLEFFFQQSFRKKISQLLIKGNIGHANEAILKFLFDEMSIYLHMLGSVILNWIVSYVKRCFIITISIIGWLLTSFNSCIKDLSQISSHFPKARDQNSVSVLDLTTIDCFLLLHVTKLPPRNVQQSDVDLWSLIEPAQSASVQASISSMSFFENRSPLPRVPFRYFKILNIAFI